MAIPDISTLPSTCKGILLDLDNTLYDYSECHAHALAACFNYFNAHIEKIEQGEFLKRYERGRTTAKRHNQLTSGSRSRHLYFQMMLEEMRGKTDAAAALSLADLYWSSFLEKITPRPWVKAFLRAARERNLAIAIVTNLESSIQMKKLIRLNIDKDIDYLVTSEEAGVEKPDQKIFRIALDKIGTKPENVVMIGDEPEADGTGAARMGISFISCG